MIIIALIAGIAIGAIGMAVLSGLLPGVLSPSGGSARSTLGRSRRDATAMGPDLDEHAGGSRHIRTNPSWRDRLE
jgi:hypothetical protein